MYNIIKESIYKKQETTIIIKEVLKHLLQKNENFSIKTGTYTIHVRYFKFSTLPKTKENKKLRNSYAFIEVGTPLPRHTTLSINKYFFSNLKRKKQQKRLIYTLIHELSHFYSSRTGIYNFIIKKIKTKLFEKSISAIKDFYEYLSSHVEITPHLHTLEIESVVKFKTKDHFLKQMKKYIQEAKKFVEEVDNKKIIALMKIALVDIRHLLFSIICTCLIMKDQKRIKYYITRIYKRFDSVKSQLDELVNKILIDEDIVQLSNK